MNSPSVEISSKPFDIVEKTLDADPKVPCTVFLMRLWVPKTKPLPASRGPLTAPSIGI